MRASQKGVLALAMVTLMAMQGCLSAIVSDTASQTADEMDAIEQLDPDAYSVLYAQRMGTVLHHLHTRKHRFLVERTAYRGAPWMGSFSF
jgi:hypothetical protein